MKKHHITQIKKSIIVLSISLYPLICNAHDGHHTKPAWEACIGKVKNQACQYIMQKNKLYSGTCLLMTDDLMCVRNQPITTINNYIN